MAKFKLKLPKSVEAKKLKVAATFAGLKILTSKVLGEFVYLELDGNHQSLADTLLLIDQVKGDELDEPAAEKAEKKK